MKLRAWEQDIRREERAEGRAEGEMLMLIGLICNKLSKGKTLEEIADDLEESIEKIEQISNVAQKYAPDYDRTRIFDELADES